MRISLEQENWQRIELDLDAQKLFKMLIDPELDKNKSPNFEEFKDKNQEGNLKIQKQDSEGSPQGQSSKQTLQQENTKSGDKVNDLKVVHNEIVFQGNKFQITSSFLLLLQNISDYLEIGFRFKFIGLDAISKAFELIKVI